MKPFNNPDITFKGMRAKIKVNEPLSRQTTLRIGGQAKFFVQPQGLADLKLLLKQAKKQRIPVLIIGQGSNLLVSDKGVEAMVIKLNQLCFRKIIKHGSTLEVGAGVLLARLVDYAMKSSFSGYEFLAGIPGTLGGALVMNAGSAKKEIADLVEQVKVMDYQGRVKIFDQKKIIFRYRESNLSKYIVISAKMITKKEKKERIRKKIKEYLEYRKSTQEWIHPNAGCIFKNPDKKSAGLLIDACGLKGKSRGGAYISSKHANFMINKGKARASDVLRLIDLVKKKVKKEFNIILEPEIKVWG